MTTTDTTSRTSHWKQDPDAVRADILRVATQEFAKSGLSGARIDEIARQTRASKRMIYYYFGDKEGLYQQVLEAAYARIRAEETDLHLETLDPVAALRRLIEFTFESHRHTPQFIRLIMIENIHNADHMRRSETITAVNTPVIAKLQALCDRGKAAGVIRQDADPLELHWTISGMCFYNVSNRATFSAAFGDALYAEARQIQIRENIVQMILGTVLVAGAMGQR